jgi:hypothetical protein
MIRKIKVNNYGSLINFSNESSPFNKENAIIHGLNGSGKSQICTLLRQIERIRKIKTLEVNTRKNEEKEIIKYFKSRISKESTSAIIEIAIDDYNISIDIHNDKIVENGNPPEIFVFNDDYVNENIGNTLNIHDQEILIGQKNVIRDELIRNKKDREADKKKIIIEIDKLVNETKINSTYSGQARTEKFINRENYLCKENPGESYSDAKDQLKNLSNPPDPVTTHLRYSFPSLVIGEEINKTISEIFSEIYIEPKLTNEIYKTYISIQKEFYKNGIELLGKTKNTCPFCLSSISSKSPSINELISYLNSVYNDSVNKLNDIITFFSHKKTEIDNFINAWNVLIPTVNEKASVLSIDKSISEIDFSGNEIENCIDLLKVKSENMDKVFDDHELAKFKAYENFVNRLHESYLAHIEFIDEINKKIETIAGLKKSLGEKIRCTYCGRKIVLENVILR